MTFGTLICRGLRFHARAHIGIVLGAAIGSAALIGALIVGDSVKESLRHRALARLGPIHFTLYAPDRLFRADLQARMAPEDSRGWTNLSGVAPGVSDIGPQLPLTSALLLRAVVALPDGSARLNDANVIGVRESQWPRLAGWARVFPTPGDGTDSTVKTASAGISLDSGPLKSWVAGESAIINDTLARRLKVRPGDEIILRVEKPSALGLEAAIAPRDQNTVALRLRIAAVLNREALGDFSLQAQQIPPANVFLPLEWLNTKLGTLGSANLIAASALESLRAPGRSQAQRWGVARSIGDQQASQLLDHELRLSWLPKDAGFSVHTLEPPPEATGDQQIGPLAELTTSRIFLEPAVVTAALRPRTTLLKLHTGYQNDTANDVSSDSFVTNGIGVLTYLANLIRCGEHSTPYSMVTAAGAPYAPADLRDDEILVNEWLAEDLQAKPGDNVEISYFVVDSGARLVERTNSFRVRNVVPLEGIYADRTLMPEFPGVAKAESTHDWDTGFPLVYTIREKDEQYWKKYRGTPKAFVTLAAGQEMWANRFGSLTAVRYPIPPGLSADAAREAVEKNLVANLDPAELGLRFEPARLEALRAASQSQDFGQLFLGFSIFIVVSALLLMGLLFQFGLEQRLTETGILLALGFTPSQVRRLYLLEGLAVAGLGGLVGAPGGIVYAKAMLWGLTTVWRGATGVSTLEFHVSGLTLVTGFVAATVVAVFIVWLALRKQARVPAGMLLACELAWADSRITKSTWWLGIGCAATAAFLVGWCAIRRETSNPGVFFAAGALLLIAGVALAATWLGRLATQSCPLTLTLSRLAVSGCARRRTRSLATISLLALGAFVIAALSVFRLDANEDATLPSSGTGGFASLGTSALPVVQDLNAQTGRDFYGLSEADLRNIRFVPFRVHQGDEASCLNLNRAQKPRLLGVNPSLLTGRFAFAAAAEGLDRRAGWDLISVRRSRPFSVGEGRAEDAARNTGSTRTAPSEFPEIAAIGDANSIQWALGKRLGDTLDYIDGQGRPFKVRLVAAVANSVLQGNLIIDETEFVRRFPNENGYRFFLIDAPTNELAKLSTTLSRALQDVGFEVTPAVDRLNAFNAVQNTYLGTFQILGGLGLLLGSAGLGVVVLRNVLERRGELGLLAAVGYRRRTLRWLVLGEHAALLAAGLGLGILAAGVAVLPSILSPSAQLPIRSLSMTLTVVLVNGVLWTVLALRFAFKGDLLAALRNE